MKTLPKRCGYPARMLRLGLVEGNIARSFTLCMPGLAAAEVILAYFFCKNHGKRGRILEGDLQDGRNSVWIVSVYFRLILCRNMAWWTKRMQQQAANKHFEPL